MKHMTLCRKCGVYTMKDICIKCNGKTENPKPAKYSPEDKYGSYRRKAKMEGWSEKGLI